MITRTIDGVLFEFNTPSILWPVGLNYQAQLAYDGQRWWLTSRGVAKAFKTREDAVSVLRQAFAMEG